MRRFAQRLVGIAGIIIFVSMQNSACGQKKGPTDEPLFITDANSFRNAKPVPFETARILFHSLQQPPFKDRMSDLRDLERLAPLGRWFIEVPIQLTETEEPDFLVLGQQTWLTGADNTWFWIVRSGSRQPKVLFVAGTSRLEVLNGKSNGYRNVRSVFETGAGDKIEKIFRYANGRYRLFHTSECTETKITFTPCSE